MFHQIQVLPADRDALRFVWHFPNDSPIDTYKMANYLFGNQTLLAAQIGR